jgi:hypothetical protein
VKTISVRQPWARAIACGRKNVENRGRTTAYRGLIAIHASGTADLHADADPRILALFGPDPRLGAAVGAVVAVADLVDCHRAATFGRLAGTCCQPWGEQYHANANGVVPAHHLVLANIRALWTPIHTPGAVMVPWTLPEDVAEAVTAQLAEVEAAGGAA